MNIVCYYCKYPLLKQEATIDHKISKWFYGKGWNDSKNKVNSCYLCNLQKGMILEGEYIILLDKLLEINPSYILERNIRCANWYIQFLSTKLKYKFNKTKQKNIQFDYYKFLFVMNNSKIVQDIIKVRPEIINSCLL